MIQTLPTRGVLDRNQRPSPRNPLALVRTETYSTYTYVDLVEPGLQPQLIRGAMVRKQETYKDAEPWIVVTFLEIAMA